MNVLYLVGSLAFGGAERQFVELLCGINKRKDIVQFACYFTETEQGYRSFLVKQGINPVLLERKSKYDFTILLRLHNYCKRNNIHLIHSFGALAGLVATIYGKAHRVPVVASTVRDAMDHHVPGKFDSIRFQSYLADRFVANSIAGFQKFKTSKKNYKVIYNGINLDRFKINNVIVAKIRKSYNLDQFDNVISMVASLSPKKDFDTLIDSIPEILKVEPKTCLLLVGDGSERSRLEEKVRDSSLDKYIIFTGYTHDVVNILANTHISVLMTNSLIHIEGTSNSLLESMAMGIPVIASIGGGTNEIIENEKNGILVEPFNQKDLTNGIIRLIRDKKLQTKFRAAGIEIVKKKFGYKRYLDEYVEIYYELMK